MYYVYEKDFKKVEPYKIDLSNCESLKSTKNEKVKKIVEGLWNNFKDKEENKFVFVDYDLNHLYNSYDANGNEIEVTYNNKDFSKNKYRENYIYTSYLLKDLIQFIKDNDEDSMIIIQGDHGIHIIDCEALEKN